MSSLTASSSIPKSLYIIPRLVTETVLVEHARVVDHL